MAMFRECPRCGSNLDPGERCDCEREREEAAKRLMELTRQDPLTGQMSFKLQVGGYDYAGDRMAV